MENLVIYISIPLIALSMIAGWFIFRKWLPRFRRPFVYGTLINLLIIGLGIGLVFINYLVAIIYISIILPLDAWWIWFSMQPSLQKSSDRKAEIRKYYKEKDLEKKRKGKG